MEISVNDTVHLERQGPYWAKVTWFAKEPQCGIKNLGGGRYVIKSSGEIKEFEKNKSEHKQQEYIFQSMKKLEGLIKTNFGIDPKKETHITLTYQTNMQDPEKLQRDYQAWWQRMRYHYGEQFDGLEYIAIAEPQGRGAWHMHVLIKANRSIDWLSYKQVRKMWQEVTGEPRARTHHSEIPQGKDDIGRYFVAYFKTIIDPNAEFGTDEEREAASKAAVKGSRLKFYPPNFKFYRTSRGIIRPEKQKAQYGEVNEEYGKPMETKAFAIMDDVGEKEVQRLQRQTHHKGRKAKTPRQAATAESF